MSKSDAAKNFLTAWKMYKSASVAQKFVSAGVRAALLTARLCWPTLSTDTIDKAQSELAEGGRIFDAGRARFVTMLAAQALFQPLKPNETRCDLLKKASKLISEVGIALDSVSPRLDMLIRSQADAGAA